MWAAVSAALTFLSALLSYVIWGKTRRRHVAIALPENSDIASLFTSIAAVTWGHVIDGNRVDIIQNSAFFDALLDDIARAEHHIHLETFLWRDGAVSDRVSAALAEAARRGIAVRILVDQRGAKQTDPAVWRKLEQSGCDFRVFHRARFGEFVWYNHRDHRKIVVIDGRVAYTFGHGIADMWGASREQPTGWRDTAARFQGPVVAELQKAFFDNWVRTAGEVPAGHDYFPLLEKAGESAVHVAYISPRETISAVQRLYYFAIAAAREEIILQNPYFLPDRHARKLFADAARRGVRISVMLPTSATSDFSIVQHASHYYYGELLRHGIRVFEYERSGLHQKVMIIDGVWCSIGSTNFDPRSFRINDEITVAICDRDVAGELHRAFEGDVAHAREWSLPEWNRRTLQHKVRDRISAMAKRQL